MTEQDRLQQLSSILEVVDHSAPSVSKYRELQRLLSKFTGLEPQLIYPTFVSKAGNMSVRSGQSKRAKSARLMVFVVMRNDQDDEIRRAAREFGSAERKPLVILQRDPDDPSWAPTYGLTPIGDVDAAEIIVRLREAFGQFEVGRRTRGSTEQASSSAPVPQRQDPVPFVVMPDRESQPETSGEALVLVPDFWDDFGFQTLFDLHYKDAAGSYHEVGQVKIAHRHQTHGRPPLPSQFLHLDDEFFSLGQGENYYDELDGYGLREVALASLHDVAYNEQKFTEVSDYEVTLRSLLRTVPRSTVESQFRRIAHGGVILRDFLFQYTAPERTSSAGKPLELKFEVFTNSEPSTNVHVIIGGNGVGKTTLLKGMSAAVSPGTPESDNRGIFVDLEADWEPGESSFPFLNVIFVSFSAFDPFMRKVTQGAMAEPDTLFSLNVPSVPISYIGLGDPDSDDRRPRDIQGLAQEFIDSVGECLRNATLRQKWLRAMESLETDPLFRDLDLRPLVESNDAVPSTELFWTNAEAGLLKAFNRSSSGHKVVLLTLTRLVEESRERSLILFDEPESHLHPPLLSAFMRALSELLTDTNGAAIIATHSPVVLQEVPKNCVWKLRRSGDQCVADRPQIETFGENVGVLTHEVFGLEVTQSGYHAELQQAVTEEESFEAVANRFGNQLGSEAQGIVRIMLAVKAAEGAR
ncbi:AAA family ATPase [Streptomyces sp. NPDC086777]|uniref:AAA family ATPase n=1 Tax=Streptomyces sp. NPDC086777 TaxID=3154866 RepID=UPI00344C1535